MNPLLSRLQPYPFERLRRLFTDVKPSPAHRAISLGLFAVCVALYLGLVGPWLISAASTLAVAAGLTLLVALLVWAWRLFGRPFN